jgi:hypothetical protein
MFVGLGGFHIGCPPTQLRTINVVGKKAMWLQLRATSYFAKTAREFAANPLMLGVTGSEALEAFANAIEKTNGKTWPKESVKN